MSEENKALTAAEKRVEKAREKLKQAQARQQQVKARIRSAESKRKRAADTRRKVLLGAYVLDLMGRDEAARAKWLERLDGWLERPTDRALFELGQDEAAEPPAIAPGAPAAGSLLDRLERVQEAHAASLTAKEAHFVASLVASLKAGRDATPAQAKWAGDILSRCER